MSRRSPVRSMAFLVAPMVLVACGAEEPSISSSGTSAGRRAQEPPPAPAARQTGPLFQNQLAGMPGDTADAGWFFSAAGNRFVPGPAMHTELGGYPYLFVLDTLLGEAAGANRLYDADNTLEANRWTASLPQPTDRVLSELSYDPFVDAPPAEAPLSNFDAQPSTSVEALVLANAGARPAQRDAVDARIVAYIAARTGPSEFGLIGSVDDVGGFPPLESTSQPWVDAEKPDEIAPGQTVRTNREMKLEADALALEP